MKKYFEERALFLWYKDRDFPEVKSGNDDIVAVISDEEQLDRIIESHNLLLQIIRTVESKNRRLIEDLEIAKKGLYACAGINQTKDFAESILQKIKD